MNRIRREFHTIEIPDDPRGKELVRRRMTHVHTKFGPLPDCPVERMECAFVLRRYHAEGYEEIVYMFDESDTQRLTEAFRDVPWSRFETFALAHPERSVCDWIEYLEKKGPLI